MYIIQVLRSRLIINIIYPFYSCKLPYPACVINTYVFYSFQNHFIPVKWFSRSCVWPYLLPHTLSTSYFRFLLLSDIIALRYGDNSVGIVLNFIFYLLFSRNWNRVLYYYKSAATSSSSFGWYRRTSSGAFIGAIIAYS